MTTTPDRHTARPAPDRTGRRLADLSPTQRAVLARWGVVVVVWGVVVAALSTAGLLSRVPLLVLPTLIAVGIAVPLLVVRRSPVQRSVVRDLDLAHLTLFNVWRVLAALAFFAVGAQGLLPARFVTNAAWGDLVAGVLAGVVVVAGTRLAGRGRVRAYTAFHVFSFGDFVVAVGTGLTFTLLGDPLMRTLLDTPMALIPLWGVPITGAISLLALHRLLTARA
ncbi:hypothetical protein [Jannaschia sp. R86511]|uniref:hypothetical protein n=1 Tax=Jannaschia sp. R86511 TaxID=3093853 RepID=UPI0036D242C0